MRRRSFLAAAATAGTPLLAGCGGGDDGGAPPESVTVRVQSPGNAPLDARVAVGGTVTWVNENSAFLNEHTVTSAQFSGEMASWEFDETLEAEGDQVSHTFEAAGTYGYYDKNDGRNCRCGAILVGDAELDQPLPCSAASPSSC
jgi:plastocyanin